MEWAARAIGLIALGALLWSLTREDAPRTPTRFAGGDLRASLTSWTRMSPSDSVQLELAAAPDVVERDWLVALRRAGARLAWRAPSVPALAVSVEPVADPRRRSRIVVAAPEDSAVIVRDDVGRIDTLSTGRLGAAVISPVVGRAAVSVGAHAATSLPADSIALRRVLVAGAASWESRFMIAALEELGWTVDARLSIAPGAVVRQGVGRTIDTSQYSVVIALDTTAAADAASIVRYVRNGGGVVLAGSSSLSPALARLAPGRAEGRWRPVLRLAAREASLGTLGYFPIRSMSREAVVIDSRDGGIAVAAHRLGAGRVVQAGFDETWRLRMAGGENGPEAHRAWWGALVSSAAFAPVIASTARTSAPAFGDAAPLAALIATLGQPRNEPFAGGRPLPSPARREAALFALAVVAFLAEWASRRLRGAP